MVSHPFFCQAVSQDVERGICRACIIYGCKTCTSEGQDTCAVCSSGYRLTANGQCENANMMSLGRTVSSWFHGDVMVI